MEQLVILFGGYTGVIVVVGIIGLIYYFYTEKKQKVQH